MKKLMVAGACVCALGLFGDTLNVPSTDYPDIATAVAAAQSGDEVVLAKSTEPYVLAKALTLPAGVSVRGETGDFNDVIISGGGTLAAAFTLNNNCSVSNVTLTLFRNGTVIGNAAWQGPYNIVNCRFTAITNSSNYGCKIIGQQGKGTVERLVIDNCRLGFFDTGLVNLGTSVATYDRLVITNNFVQTGFASDGHPVLLNFGQAGVVKNSFIGNNTMGPMLDMYVAKGQSYGPVVSIGGGTLQNCVIVGNTFEGCATGFGAVNSTGGAVKNCIILDNGLGTDNWSKVGGSRYSYCLTTDTELMTATCLNGDWGDVVAKPGELPWIPYGSRALGAGTDGGDIGRIWTPETLKCAIKQDKRGYVGAATANLLALASEEATFTWTRVSGAATLTPDGKNATLAFDGPGEAVVRVTATTASETATDEITVVSTPAVYEVATAAELEAAVDVAQDGAEIVLAIGDYVPTKTLVLKHAVTVRGATGNRYDVAVSGNNARRVFTIDHPGAVISSLTVKNGSSGATGGVCMEVGGMLTNVCITGCKGTGWSGSYESPEWYFTAGGAVGNWNGKVLDCDFVANTQSATYNGIMAYGQHGSLAFADRIVVTNNNSTAAPDEKYHYQSMPVAITGGGTIRNAFVANNNINRPNSGTKYQDATGVFVYNGTLENSTVFRNRVNADYLGYAAGVYLTANGSVVNCLVTENGDTEGNVDNYRIASGATFDHCATAPVPAEGTECVDYSASPLTLYDINAAGYPVPKPETPTVDTGADLDWTVEPTAIDLFGNLRKQGELTDIGAYEKKPSTDALLCELTVVCDAFAAAPYDVTLGAIVSGSRKTGLSYMWSAIRTYLGVVTTNTVVTADPAYVFTDLEKGDWAFALTVTNDHEPPDVATSETDGSVLHLSPEICYVSPSGSHEWPYDTPATAATNFVDVAAEARGRVIVLPGAYENLPHVTDANGKDFVGIFDKSVTIEGPDDPRAATINCAGRGGLKLENRDAKLWGVAFTNFSIGTSQSALTVAAGLASNVVVDAGKKYGWQGANYVNVGPGATLTDSLLTGSKTTNWQGGYVLSCKGGLIKNCRIVDNHSDDSRIFYLAYDSGIQRPGRMEGCVITNNSSFYSFCDFSGAVVVEDCLFEKNNTAYNNGNYPLISLPASAVLRRCRILRNKIQSTLIGCNGWDLTAPPRIENCLIADNTLTSKGGYVFYVTPNVNAAASVLNTTIVNNQGGGIYYGNNVGVAYPNQLYMTNSVVWANVPVGATVATNVIGTVAKPKLAHNCYSEAVEDDGNFNTAQDPQLRASGRKIYQPKPTSPCVATGDAWFWTEDDVDVAGNPRLRKGAVDMGCYEPIFPGLLLMVK